MKKMVCFFIGLLIAVFAEAQKSSIKQVMHDKLIGPFLSGDDVSKVHLKNMMNYPKKSVNLASFKGKWLLLDFWSTHCAACIERFPEMEMLQAKYNKDLQIVLIDASENLSVINKFLEKRKQISGKAFKMAIAYADKRLDDWFDHEGVPFYVLVDPTGKIKAMPDAQEVTDKNMLSVIKNEPVTLTQKAFKLINVNAEKPLFINSNGGQGENLLWYSVLSKKVDGFPSSSSLTCDEKLGYRFYALNTCIRALYQMAYYDGFRTDQEFQNSPGTQGAWVLSNRTILRVRDTTRYVEKVNGIYQEDHRFVYQLIAPKTTYTELKKAVQSDLKKYFGLNVSFEKRIMKCLVLSSTDTSAISTKGNTEISNFSSLGADFRNEPFQLLFFFIAYGTKLYYSPYPLIDETGIRGNVDIRFDADMNDWQSIANAISKFNLRFELKEHEVNVLILSEPENLPVQH